VAARSDPTAIIGAGPYGLSVAAHLRARGLDVAIFGEPMSYWERMPAGMYLKSPWSASSLSAPGGQSDLDHYVTAVNAPAREPIPLPTFLQYGHWFRERSCPPVDPTSVCSLTRNDDGFQLELADGRRVRASRVIVATGIRAFAHIPEFARELPAAFASHTQAHQDPSVFRGQAVAVIGSGQSALEWAALLNEADADVELIARGPVLWVNRKLYDHTGPARRIFYPPTDVGPPGLNWLIAFPLLLRHLPAGTRLRIHRRAVRPAGARWLKPRVDGRVRITAQTSVRAAHPTAGRLRLELSDGTSRDVDHLLLGTGYRPALEKLPFIEASLQRHVRTSQGFPVLNEWFESSVQRLHFVGGVAGYSFGPLCNFVAGAGVAARQIARRADRQA
jgi:NADPH-dependent 2,4-dienoyl-CoA reductase/sulfur reductase-like enzyme